MDTAVIRSWAEHDPDPATREQILTWLEEHNTAALTKAFAGPLSFGTAGIRAALGPGPSHMNLAVVLRTSWGLIHWLRRHIADPKVVVGCDARHGSREFAAATAEVIAAAGGTALTLPPQQPTPLTAFSVKALGADAGVMITASHNPPQDNGYKVYLGGRIATGPAEGVQLISPADQEIAALIATAPPADMIPRRTEGIHPIDTREDYLTRALTLAGPMTHLRIALTPMHGVGGDLGHQLLSRAGFDVHLVPRQAKPDPLFPTTAFPNPEEPGALDEAIAFATSIRANILIAYDPDADRCAVAEPAGNRWRCFTGDEVGALLGDYLARRGATGTFANSLVSSRLLGRIADHYGLHHEETLTGFKWIARTPNLSFGYEEAIGYCPDPHAVRDKDGMATSLVVASLAAEARAAGSTLAGELSRIHATVGALHTAPLTFRVADTGQIPGMMAQLTTNDITHLAGASITRREEFAQGHILYSDADDRVIVRPSGTEPKVKVYLESPDPERLKIIAKDLQGYLDL